VHVVALYVCVSWPLVALPPGRETSASSRDPVPSPVRGLAAFFINFILIKTLYGLPFEIIRVSSWATWPIKWLFV
jgi:hypothetical protein